MTCVHAYLLVMFSLITTSGCLCTPGTWRACDLVDDVSDHQLCLDECYDPTHDISRARMPDWNSKPCNRKLCQHGQTCECQQARGIWYPAEYRTAYAQKLNADQMKQQAPVPIPE